MNKTYSALLAFLMPILLLGQNETDLFRYSKTTYHGSARFEAMGGAFGALGADLSSSQINPAGFGRFSSSQFGMSFFGGWNNTTAYFNQTGTNSSKGQGGLTNMAMVLTTDVSTKQRGNLYSQFGFGYNQIESFKNSYTYTGEQYASLLDNFTSQIQGYTPTEVASYFPFSSNLAVETGMIKHNNDDTYYSLLSSGDMLHNRTVNTKGGVGEYFLSYSANYVNRLYWGINMGIRRYKYEEDYYHHEDLTNTSGTPLTGFDYHYYLKTTGTGVNFKIGAIYLLSEAFRVGLAVHTPTYTELTDYYTADMTAYYKDSTVSIPSSSVPYGNYKYKIRNPFRFIASAAYVFGTKGCINVDVEYLDYRQAHFRSTTDPAYAAYDYSYENSVAKSVFQSAINVRAGGEYVVIPGLYLRAGFGYYGNAFRSEQQVELKPDILVSGGIGIKTEKFGIDLAYRNRLNEINYYAFYGSVTKLQQSISSIIASITFYLK